MPVTLQQIYNENKSEHASIVADMKVIREIITGNGSPDKGIVVKQARIEERQKYIMETFGNLTNHIETFREEFRDYVKSTTNRRSSSGRLFGVVPRKIMETIWMWIVRSVIILGLSLFTWICGNSDDVGFILDKAKEMKQTEGVVK
jgi:hypothetical protein